MSVAPMPGGCTVIVLAAGQGTRMKSKLPKVLHALGGKSLLGHALDAAAQLNPERLCVVLRHQKEIVQSYLTQNYPQVVVAEQDEIPGTGRAVQCALSDLVAQAPLTGTVVVTSGDVPLLSGQTLNDLVAAHQEVAAAVTVLTTKVPDPTGYGRIIRPVAKETQNWTQVSAIVEHRDASPEQLEIDEINAGVYAFDAEFLSSALLGLDTNNDQGEVYLTDTIAAAQREGRLAQAFLIDDFMQAEGCNDRVQLAQLNQEYHRRVNLDLMRSGVTIVAPEQTWITGQVTIAADAIILPGCHLSGTTRIAADAVIGPNTSLHNVTVGAQAQLRYCDLADCQVEERTVWAHQTASH